MLSPGDQTCEYNKSLNSGSQLYVGVCKSIDEEYGEADVGGGGRGGEGGVHAETYERSSAAQVLVPRIKPRL